MRVRFSEHLMQGHCSQGDPTFEADTVRLQRQGLKRLCRIGLRVAPGEIVGIVNAGGMRRDIIDVYG